MKKLVKILCAVMLAVSFGTMLVGCSDIVVSKDGRSPYDMAVEYGFEGTEEEWLASLKGKSDYELAVENGLFTGSVEEWLEYRRAKSNYEIAVANGFEGSEQEWLNSLKGKSAYELAVEGGFSGTKAEWLALIKGDSAYDIAVSEGFTGTKEEWIKSLNGEDGESAYDIAVANGYEGSEEEWLESLNGQDGQDGQNGTNGTDGRDVTASSLFEEAVARGVYENTAEGFHQFILDYKGELDDDLIDYINSLTTTSIALVGAKLLHQVVGVYIPSGNSFQMGTGVIYKITDDYAYIITNYHVVAVSSGSKYTIANEIHLFTYNAVDITLDENNNYTYGESDIQAAYIGGAAMHDLAVLKVTGEDLATLKAYGGQEITFADTNNIQLGMTAIAVGNALGEGISLTSGVISMDSEKVALTIAGTSQNIRSLRMDTPINSGNSGGGLFNDKGELIGINDSKYTGSYTADNICNAIPASDAKAVVENIVYYYEQALADEEVQDKITGVHKYMIGIVYNTVSPNATYDEVTQTNTLSNKIHVASVVDGGTADSIGIIADDIIKAIVITHDGTTTRHDITLDYELVQLLLTVREGDQISFVLDRVDGENQTQEITTGLHTVVKEGYTIINGTTTIQSSVSSVTE